MSTVLGLAVLGVVGLAGLAIVWQTLTVGISPLPSSARARDAMLALLPPTLEGPVHELGAGWGTVAVPLARRLPNATVIAWERSVVPFAVLWLRARGLRNLEVRRADFFGADFSRASAVVCYLFTGAMERLSRRLRTDLPPGAVVVTHTFALRGWQPELTQRLDDLYRTPVYRYRVEASSQPLASGGDQK